MDFARINPAQVAETPATWDVTHAGDPVWNGTEDKQLQIDFYGLDSGIGKRATAEMARKLDAASGGVKSIKNMDVDRIINRANKTHGMIADFYAELVTGWRNIPDLEKERKKDGSYPELPFSKEAAAKLFRDCEWMKGGIEDFLAQFRLRPLEVERD